jgi:hypothetical protein
MGQEDKSKPKNEKITEMTFEDNVKYIVEIRRDGVSSNVSDNSIVTCGCIKENKDSLILAILRDNTNRKPVGVTFEISKTKIREWCQSDTCVIYSIDEFNSKFPNFIEEFQLQFEKDRNHNKKRPTGVKPQIQESQEPGTVGDGSCVVTYH